jgi:hypothetical protein
MGTCQAEKDFSGVHSDAGQIPAQAVGRIQGDLHFLPSSHWATGASPLRNDVTGGAAETVGGPLEQSVQ